MDKKPAAVFSPDDIKLVEILIVRALSGVRGEWHEEQKKQMVNLYHRLGRVSDNA